MTHPSKPPRFKSRIVRFFVRLVVVSVLTLLLAEIALRFMTRTKGGWKPVVVGVALMPYRPPVEEVVKRLDSLKSSKYVTFDAELGWCIGADASARMYSSNAQRVRGPRDRVISAVPAPGVVRIVTVGDSFTHCDGVKNEQTWQERLASRRPELEVLNLGVPGFGTDQAELRWERDAKQFGHQIAVLGIFPENICRNVNLCRYYLYPDGGYLAKPRFVLESDGLRLVNSPVPESRAVAEMLGAPSGAPLLKYEHWYDPAETEDRLLRRSRVFATVEALWRARARRIARERLYSDADPVGNDTTCAIAERFSAAARTAGAPVVLLFPMRDLLAKYPTDGSLPLVARMRARGLHVVDLSAAFHEADARGAHLYAKDGHLSVEGNDFVADELARRLAR